MPAKILRMMVIAAVCCCGAFSAAAQQPRLRAGIRYRQAPSDEAASRCLLHSRRPTRPTVFHCPGRRADPQHSRANHRSDAGSARRHEGHEPQGRLAFNRRRDDRKIRERSFAGRLRGRHRSQHLPRSWPCRGVGCWLPRPACLIPLRSIVRSLFPVCRTRWIELEEVRA